MLNFRQVTAKDNKIIKLVTLLQKSSAARRENKLFVLEGLRLCGDAASCGIKFETLIVSKNASLKFADSINKYSANSKDLIEVPDELLVKMSDTVNPQGIMAVAHMPDISVPIKLSGRYIALEHVADPANIGAISRTAEALGISGLIVSSDSCDIYSPKVLRASMGTIIRLPVYVCNNVLSFLNTNSLRAFACIPKEDADLKFGDFKFGDGDAVLIGNEANGLKKDTVIGAYKTITIKMRGRAESLNAASAAAIAMWELIK